MRFNHIKPVLLAIAVTITFIQGIAQRTALSEEKTFSDKYRDSVKLEGHDRYYNVHLPTGYDHKKHLPLVILLHGGGGKGKQMNGLTKFNLLADKESFIVVCPDGFAGNWNDGKVADNEAARSRIDDVGFISALIDRLASELKVDTQRVYAAGISNGGMMSLQLAGQLSDKIAAVAAVAASSSENSMKAAPGARAVPVLIMNGTDDPVVPFKGGEIQAYGKVWGTVRSTEETVKYWVERNGCNSAAIKNESVIPDTNKEDGSRVSVEKYSGCKNKTEVILYRIHGGGHTWPGGPQYLPVNIIGRTNCDFDATKDIWEFFKMHAL